MLYLVQDETLQATEPAQLKALAHPLRQRLLYALGGDPATMAQLAQRFGENKGNIGHHLKVLHAAGLVRIVETRQVRGGTEHYYQRTTRRVYVGGPPAASTTAMLQAVADEITSTPEEPPVLILRLPDGLLELDGRIGLLVEGLLGLGDPVLPPALDRVPHEIEA